MNLTEIRAAMFAQADWSPEQSEEAVGRINGFINRAYNQLALEAPFLFFEDKLRVAVEPDEKSASDSDTLQLLGNNELASPAVDPWSFVTTYTKTVAEADTDGAYTTTWKTDRSWDGRVIEIQTRLRQITRGGIRGDGSYFPGTSCDLPALAAGPWTLRYGGVEASFDMPYEGVPICTGPPYPGWRS